MYCLEVLFRAFGMLTLSRELQHRLRDRPMEEGFRIVFVGKRVKRWENDFGSIPWFAMIQSWQLGVQGVVCMRTTLRQARYADKGVGNRQSPLSLTLCSEIISQGD